MGLQGYEKSIIFNSNLVIDEELSSMHDYLLFIDTETTGLPIDWSAPYSDTRKWPSALQVAWIVCSWEGNELKRENYYVRDGKVAIEPKSEKIHRLNAAFLQNNGKTQSWVMSRLADDLNKYQPLIIGHFVELDYHVLGADFHRCSISNPLKGLPLFCTMLASAKYIKKPWIKYLRLSELYTELFQEKLEGSHNAAVDVAATVRSFFEMQKRGDITEETIDRQQKQLDRRAQFLRWEAKYKQIGLFLLMLFVFLIFYLLLIK